MGIAVRLEPSLGTFEQTYSHFKEILHVFPCTAPAKTEAKEGRWVLLEELHGFPCRGFTAASPTGFKESMNRAGSGSVLHWPLADSIAEKPAALFLDNLITS